MKVGSFVRVDSSELGLGKLVRLGKTVAEVSYFSSPARGEAYRESVAPSRLRFESLQAQTRVYWYDSDRSAWLVGRVAEDGRIDGRDLGSDEDYYLVHLPNEQSARVAVSALHVRWDRPVDDPVAYLAARTTETPYWHFGRRKFLRQVVTQRALCGALTGLWSATLDLKLHQFRAVRTVLTDPVQRYLLADEVGLGKTIEAGAILRQYVLDEPNAHRAMIVVPQHLVGQWTDELKFRFYLGPYLGRSVHVISATDASAIRGAVHDLGMLIVDEAHHPASMAFSLDADQRRRYVELAGLARRTPRLLLLSGTPVLRNEDGFLAMLHLLEPEAYPLEDREAFRHRVQNRQKLAESISDLQPDSPSLFVEDALNTLERLTSGDARAGTLIARVRDRIAADDNDSERQDAIRDLREHIGEVYRLHRRLIRHRREIVTGEMFERAGATVLPVYDPIRRRLAELLELWREHANLHIRLLPNGKSSAVRLYWLLLQAAASHPAVLHELVAARCFNREASLELTPSSQEDFGLLHTAEVFPQEREILDELLAIGGTDADPRIDAVVKIVRAQARGVKTVLFVDAPGVADYIANVLGPLLSGSVLRYAPGSSLEPFCNPKGSASVLVCDRRAEEGLNLQAISAQVVHLDLPLDPGRIEQRIGRVDRLGARSAAASIVFAYEDPLAEAWRRCLQEVIRVFDRSVASLQYVLEEQLQALRETLFEGGVEAIEDFIAQLKDGDAGLEAELKRIRTQEQLDSIAEASEAEEKQFETLEEFDLEDDDFRDGIEGWVLQRLHFRRLQEEQDSNVVRYSYVLGRGLQTLLPPDQFVRWCGASVDTSAGSHARATRRLAFSRSWCLRKKAELARIGHPFVDGLVELARRDDRGVAHAMWRLRPGLRLPFDPWLVFGFDYIIEADPEVARLPETAASGIDITAIRRRLDSVLPPRYATVWIDQELEPVDDPTTLAALEQPYDDRRTSGRGDWNLSAARWGVVRRILHVGAWDQLCFEAAARALAVLKDRLSLDDELRRAEQRIDERLARVQAQLNARFSRLATAGAAAERRVLAIEEFLAEGARRAVRAPRVTPDSAFAVFLSNFDPFTESAR